MNDEGFVIDHVIYGVVDIEAASTAREAATVVLPVPPLPMTARKRRSRRSDAMRGDRC